MRRAAFAVLALSIGGLRAALAAGQEAPATDRQGEEFFEKKIRPLLAERCVACHGASSEKIKGGLRLDSRAGILKGGDSGAAVVPGDPDRSLLVRAVRYSDPELRMPPKREGKLSTEQMADVEAWVRRGAPVPVALSISGTASPRARAHWAFQPVRNPAPPPVRMKEWVVNDLDRFVLAKLEEKGLRPSPAADRRTLLRRLTFDLIGLAPTAEETEAFEADSSPDAVRKVVDRLLASPHYGERWGRYWLDVARYADTKGYPWWEESRFVHPHTYRDWVIDAFNRDLPYDQFLIQQMAADRLLASGELRDRGPLAALGFLTLGPRFENIHDIIDDRIDVVCRGTLALTVGCARCHDHKYDPIPTEDYYSLYGIFDNSMEAVAPLAGPAVRDETFEVELRRRREAADAMARAKREDLSERRRARVKDYFMALLQPDLLPPDNVMQILGPDDLNPYVARRWQDYLYRRTRDFDPVWAPWSALMSLPEEGFAGQSREWLDREFPRLNPRVAEAFRGTAPKRREEVAAAYGRLFSEVHRQAKSGGPARDPAEESLRRELYGPESPVIAPVGPVHEIRWYFDNYRQYGETFADVDRWILEFPAAPPHATVLADKPLLKDPRVFRRGNPALKGDIVPRRFLGVLSGESRPTFTEGSGRLDLARAVASPGNPLTARVIVNRVWMWHFGRGLVETPSDFGLRSDPPTHPELLDWMATFFVKSGWSLKALHRLIVLSAAYRQDGRDNPEARRVDPENRLLWRASRRRLDFEAMHDAMLQASGALDDSVGGPSMDLASRPFSPRRAVYGFVDRQNPEALLAVFDVADPATHNPRRHVTTVPQQALFLMNGPFAMDQARRLAASTRVDGEADPEPRLRRLYRRVYGRDPSAEETALGLRFVGEGLREEIRARTFPWRYGSGTVDDASGRVCEFRPAAFAGGVWTSRPSIREAKFHPALLTAQGGQPGRGADRAVIRRWVAPAEGTVSVGGAIAHKAKEGNGIRARIVSSRSGEVASWTLLTMEAETKVGGIPVKEGDALDFVVDSRGDPAGDSFSWAPVARLVPPSKAGAAAPAALEWNAAADFAGPPTIPLGPWEMLAQSLLVSNEFMFVD